jgi:hypothetical protein
MFHHKFKTIYTLWRKLHKLGPNGVLRHCLSPVETNVIFTELHDGSARGHYGINTIVKNLLILGCWLPIVQRDVAKLCQSCDICQQLVPMYRNGKGPL